MVALNMRFLRYFVLFLSVIGTCSGCNTFKDVLMTAKPKHGSEFNITINGCVERKSFDDKVIAELYARQQTIPILKRDSIRHLVQLRVLSFFGCGIETIEPGVFRNVPRLSQVLLAYGKLQEIPYGVFNGMNIERLRIHNNIIDTIGERAFSNMSNLVDFYAADNKIEYYNQEWFFNSTNLQVIDLQSNMLRSIPRKAFVHNKNLKRIFFDYNEIDVIHEDAFQGLKELQYLGLRYNHLKTINSNSFPKGLIVDSMLIDANRLNFLTKNLMQRIAVKHITLDGNPWTCPCLEKIRHWIHEKNGTIRSSDACLGNAIPVCAYSKLSNACIEVRDDEATDLYYEQLAPIRSSLNVFCVRFEAKL